MIRSTLNISVIITNYNYGAFLERAIESVLSQENVAVELIIVDDGSTDNSHDIFQKYAHKAHIITQSNQGACAARNAGLDVAKGTYIKFLDADDWLVENTLHQEYKLALQLSDSTNSIIYGKAIWIDEEEVEKHINTSTTFENGLVEISLERIAEGAPITSAPLHKKDLLNTVGGFDPRVKRAQEYDLHFRLALSGVRFFEHPNPVYFYRQHGDPNRISAWSDATTGQSMLQTTQRHLDSVNAAYEGDIPLVLKDALAKKIWHQGREAMQRGAKDTARQFINLSKELSPNKNFSNSKLYIAVTSVFGLEIAEKLSKVRRSWYNLKK